MKNLENILNSAKRILGTSLLAGAVALSPFYLGGCDRKPSVKIPKRIAFSDIPDQIVEEGNSIELRLGQYLTVNGKIPKKINKNYRLIIAGGEGSIDKNLIYRYQDIEDDDGVDNLNVVKVDVVNKKGKKLGEGYFKVIQKDKGIDQPPNEEIIIRPIPMQEVSEGWSLELNLERYIKSNSEITITQTGGPGGFVDKTYKYQDIEDKDAIFNLYTVLFKITNKEGKEKIGSFTILQNDKDTEECPVYYPTKLARIGDTLTSEDDIFFSENYVGLGNFPLHLGDVYWLMDDLGFQVYNDHKGGYGDTLEVVSYESGIYMECAFAHLDEITVFAPWKGKVVESEIKLGDSIDTFVSKYPDAVKGDGKKGGECWRVRINDSYLNAYIDKNRNINRLRIDSGWGYNPDSFAYYGP